MAISERQADVTWNGDLAHGQGRLTAGSGAVEARPITGAARTERGRQDQSRGIDPGSAGRL